MELRRNLTSLTAQAYKRMQSIPVALFLIIFSPLQPLQFEIALLLLLGLRPFGKYEIGTGWLSFCCARVAPKRVLYWGVDSERIVYLSPRSSEPDIELFPGALSISPFQETPLRRSELRRLFSSVPDESAAVY